MKAIVELNELPKSYIYADELRIGNSIDIFGSESQVFPYDFSPDHHNQWLKTFKGRFVMDGWKPIPLTEEWLLKFHTEEQIEKNTRFPNEIIIYDRFKFIWKDNYKYWYVITSYHNVYLTKIEFVHEYQNFIFALTGEELTIK